MKQANHSDQAHASVFTSQTVPRLTHDGTSGQPVVL